MQERQFPTIGADAISWLTEQQMIEVDRAMIDDLGIQLIQMMENAGRSLARLALALYEPSSVTIYAGTGGNGGGGLVAARHLANAGVAVSVLLSRDAERFVDIPGHQLSILRRMDVNIGSAEQSDVAIDALIGYSLRGAPSGRSAELIETINAESSAVLALDTPSGLNVSTGEAPGSVVNADATMTLALPKIGMRGASEIGALYLADISVPPQVMVDIGAVPAPFAGSALLEIDDGR